MTNGLGMNWSYQYHKVIRMIYRSDSGILGFCQNFPFEYVSGKVDQFQLESFAEQGFERTHLISSKWFCAWAQDPHLREKKKTMDLIIKAIDDKSVINCDLN